MTAFTATDHLHRALALRLAERGAYTTKPNPMVGCVVALGDEVVGEGFHQRAGEAHAEVLALQEAGGRAYGATAYVTLEPCAHTGRTGPCADALIAAGITRVVAAMRDPFPQVDGAGFDKLRAAGITVESGLMEVQARQLNRGFLSRVERGRPWVRIKLGTSLDGRTAMASGESKWITGEPLRQDVQKWRARAGAILTGANTVLIDDPSLTVRLGDDTPFVPPLRARQRCTSWREASPLIHLESPEAVAVRPSRLDASLTRSHGRPRTMRERKPRLSSRACASISPSWTSMPAARRRSKPAPSTFGNGSRIAATTRATPASISASAHGPVLPVCAHGSRVT